MQGEQFGFTGHTEFFAHEFGGDPLMLMCSDLLKVGLVTIHIPVSEVSASVTKQRIVTKLRELRQSLIQDFSVREPRIAVLSLNPHAGDGGLIGSEEKEIIVPAIQAASQQKILAFGPFAADGFFRFGRLYEIRRRAGDVPRSGTRSIQGAQLRRGELYGGVAGRPYQSGARRGLRHRRGEPGRRAQCAMRSTSRST